MQLLRYATPHPAVGKKKAKAMAFASSNNKKTNVELAEVEAHAAHSVMVERKMVERANGESKTI